MRCFLFLCALIGSLTSFSGYSSPAKLLHPSTHRGLAAVHKTTPTQFILFGDSLSDTGNAYEYSHHQKPLAPIYYQGRYSNGPIWIDYVLNNIFPKSVKPKLLNYAFGGAGALRSQPHVFVLSQEIDSYLLTHSTRPNENTWFVMWIGANDYLLHPDSSVADVHKVIAEIERNIVRLIQKGAQHIIVIGLPDLGMLPYAEDLDVQSPLSTLAQLHNQELKAHISMLKKRFAQTDWYYMDVNQTFTELMANPKHYGFMHTHERCLEPAIMQSKSGKKIWLSKQQKNCRKYIFFDQFHPTTDVHQIVAKELLKIILPS